MPGRDNGDGAAGFACADTVLLRAAVRPPGAVAGSPDPGDAARLRQAAADELFREAVALASPSLARVLDRAAAGQALSPKETGRASRAVTRYQLRMSGRATPFGIMAGVTAAGFGPVPRARWGSAHTKAARADMGWLLGVVARLERDPTVLALLDVTANDLCTVRGDRLVLPFVPAPGRDEGPHRDGTDTQEVSVRHTEPVRRAFELAATPVAWPDLVKLLGEDHPEVATDTVARMAAELVRLGLLLTGLRPPLDDGDPVEHVLGLLAGHSGALSLDSRRVVDELIDIRSGLAAYAAAPVGRGGPALTALTDRMRALRPAERSVQVDLALDADVRLPLVVREEAERAARALVSLSAGRPGPRHLRDFHAKFLERYGTGRSVPLLELLDPARGLGAPDGYGAARTPGGRSGGGSDEGVGARDRLLLAWAQEAAMASRRELLLDDELLAELRGAAAGPAPEDGPGPPPSFDLLAEVLADSVTAMAEGEFRLVVGGVSGVAGAVAGRFAHVLGEAAEDFGRVVRSVPTRNPAAVRAQLGFSPRTGRAANVSKVPGWLDHTITVSAFTDRGSPRALGLAELAVVAEPRRLALVSTALGREVVPTLPAMVLPPGNAPDVARFLEEIQRGGEAAWPGWDWGTAAALPFLPRVRYGRTVLAPARWRPADPALGTPATPPGSWRRRFAAWRARAGVPDEVASVYADHRIALDLKDPGHLELLRHEWQRRPGAFLQELPAAGAYGHGWSGGRPTEVAFPLVRTTPGTARPPAISPVRPHPVHAPGSRWLYAKLYCAAEHQDTLLARRLPGLLSRLPEEVDRWHFLRYSDPAPHLRLRFHGTPEVLGGRLLPLLGRWADELRRQGWCARMVLDAYEPEWERYGGPEAMADAEAAFDADSRACLDQVALLREGALDIDPRLLAAANYVDLAHRFFPGTDGPGHREAAYRLAADAGPLGHRAAPAALRQEARRLVDPEGRWIELARRPGGAQVLRAWERRGPAVAAYGARLRGLGEAAWAEGGAVLTSLSHMHHNRLVGTARGAEEESLALARLAVRAHIGREQAGA
ncbi:lantibiotic dehydratase [Streptomyces syringium]|uniref:lantibiotic dehydratase n=1 Tax=Streptomyces syringium TaxID=76729 RepID=UPI003AAE3898